jgi:FtsH-binding integral membrane protein
MRNVSARAWGALVADLVCVLVFTTIGRASHAEGITLPGLASTAWPFLVGCLVGSAVAARRSRPRSLRSGLLVWLGTVLLGLLLRAATGGGVVPSFVVVTAVVLAVFLLGWRAVLLVVGRTRNRTGVVEAEPTGAARR